MMSLFERFRKKGAAITAAVYISIDENLDSANVEKEVAKQLQAIFKFINLNTGIVIVESYIDRDGSTREWNWLLDDFKSGKYGVILTCGTLTVRETIEVPIIDVLKTISSN